MIEVGVVGARGYTGGELLRYLVDHPHLRVTYVTSDSQAGEAVAAAFPTLAGRLDLAFSRYDPTEAAAAAQLLFFARPDGEAMRLVPELLAAGRKVVDLSGDFRVRDPDRYAQWYRREHVAPEWLPRAVYGVPELHPEVREARLVANPGCYAVASLLAVAPLVEQGLADLSRPLCVAATSGISGACSAR